MIEFNNIKNAMDNVKKTARDTPLIRSNSFSDILGSEIFLKLENHQRTGSFKIRGATNKIANCLEDCQKRVVTASAGNHAQGVALSATRQQIDSTVFMPKVAPKSKVMATRDYGAEVVLYGENYDMAREKAIEYGENNNLE